MSYPYLSSHADQRHARLRDAARVSGAMHGAAALNRYLRIVANSLNVPIVQINAGVGTHESLAWIGASVERCPADISLDRIPWERRTLTIIPDVADVDGWCDHPLSSHPLNVRWYAGQPILEQDTNVAPCVIAVLSVWDVRPRELSAADRAVLRDTAALIAEYLQPGEPLLDRISEGLYVMGADGAFEYINRPGEQIIRQSREDLIGRRMDDVFPGSLDSEIGRFLQQARETGESGALTTFFEPLQIWMEARVSPWLDGIVLYIRDITDRKQTEDQIRLFSRVIEETSESIMITDGDVEAPGGPRIRHVNAAFEQMTGYAAEEVIGERPSLLQGPDTDRRVLDRVRAQIEGGHPVTDETVNYKKDGTPFNIEWNIAPVRLDDERITHWVSVQRDVTEARRMERERERARHRAQALHQIGRAILTASSPEDIAQATLQRIGTLLKVDRASVVNVNETTRTATILAVVGTSRGGMDVGDTVDLSTFREVHRLHGYAHRVIRNLDTEATAPIEHRLLQIGIQSYVSVPLIAEGEMVGVLNIGSALPDGFPPATVEAVRDVADMLAVALQQRRYKEELILAKERAEEMNQLKTAFLANMSHEVRTPLTSIIGFADMITEQPEDALDFAPFIQHGGERLLRTLSAVLDFAQLESNTYVFSPGEMDLRSTVQEVVDLFQREAVHRGITMQYDLPTHPVHLHADVQTIERIVTCVVENAIKFTDGGEVQVAVAVTDGEAELRVSDTGVGISPGFLPHVFDEFRQESVGDGRTHEGNGLGLAITRQFVERAGGTIRADSVKGEGTTVTIRFPVKKKRRRLKEARAAQRTVQTSNENSTSRGNMKRSGDPPISAAHE